MKKKFSRGAKSAMAVAIAVAMAVPTASALTGSAKVNAAISNDFPDPVKVYNFNSADEVTMTAVGTNEATIENDETRGNAVFNYKDAVPVEVTGEVVVVTPAGTIVTDPVTGVTSASVEEVSGTVVSVVDTYYQNSSAEIENPFYGREDLSEKVPSGYVTNDSVPNWEKGVTISYWQKTAGQAEGSDGTMLTFNNTREGVLQKDDLDKYKLAQMYFADKENPLFSTGTDKVMTKADLTGGKYNGKTVAGMTAGKEYHVYEGFGMFIRMNENYVDDGYYFKPVLTASGSVKSYSLTAIGAKIDLSEFREVMSESSKIRYGTEKGSLAFMSSGSWGFIEGGETDFYTNGKLIENTTGASQQLNGRNNCAAYTYIDSPAGKVYQKLTKLVNEEETDLGYNLIDNSEWHYVSYVIKNDSISIYVDGELEDTALYTDRVAEKTVQVNKVFNLGWGYYSSGSDAGITVMKGGSSIFNNAESITVPENGEYAILNEDGSKSTLGFNGNATSITLMEFITNECTSLMLGEDGNNMDALDLEYGTKAGNSIDSIAFFDEPLDADQIKAVYAYVQTQDLETVVPPVVSETPSPEPSPSDVPSETPVESDTPSETVTPGTSEEPSPSPSAPAAYAKGDANLDNTVDLNDAQLVLKAALGITKLEGEAFTVADVVEDGNIDLADAQAILKIALGIS